MTRVIAWIRPWRRSLLGALAARLAAAIALASPPPAFAADDPEWLGINHGANDFSWSSSPYPRSTLIADMNDTGVRIVKLQPQSNTARVLDVTTTTGHVQVANDGNGSAELYPL